MREYAIIFFALVLTGCGQTGEGDLLREVLSSKGAEVMDRAAANAEWALCNAISIGAARRRFGQSLEIAEAYRTLCETQTTVNIIAPRPLAPLPGE